VPVALPGAEHPGDGAAVGMQVLGDLERHVGESSVGA
jgi:hypothetical protein